MDDPIDTRSPTEPVAPGLRELPPYLVAGNRFGSYGFGAGLSGLLLTLAPVRPRRRLVSRPRGRRAGRRRLPALRPGRRDQPRHLRRGPRDGLDRAHDPPRPTWRPRSTCRRRRTSTRDRERRAEPLQRQRPGRPTPSPRGRRRRRSRGGPAPPRPPGSGSRRCPARSARGRRRPGSRRSHGSAALDELRRGSPRRSGRGRGRGSAAGAGCRRPRPARGCRRPCANGVPGWSTAVLRFSSVNTRPARSPSSASRRQGRRRPCSHIAGVTTSVGQHRQPLLVEPGAVHVEPRAVELLGDLQRLLGGAQQLLGAVRVGERAGDVAGHRRERGTGARRARRRPCVVQSQISTSKPASAIRRTRSSERQVEEHHLGADGQPEAHFATSSIRTGRPARTDSAAARAIASAARASSPVTGGGRAGAHGVDERRQLARRRRRAAAPGRCARCRPAARRRRRSTMPVRAAVAHGGHAAGAEHLAAHVVAVGGLEAGLGRRRWRRCRSCTTTTAVSSRPAVAPAPGSTSASAVAYTSTGLGAGVEEPQRVEVVDQGLVEDRVRRDAGRVEAAGVAGHRAQQPRGAERAVVEQGRGRRASRRRSGG